MSRPYSRSLKTAAKTATNAPVASDWALAVARLADALAEADPEAAVADPDEEPEAVVDADVAIVEEPEAVELALPEVLGPEARALDEAFKVPHFSFAMQVFWPTRSFGWLAIHWLYVAWQM